MQKLSENEIEELYKDIKLKDVPSMWENIESNLAPKKKVIPFRRIASIAAAVLLVCVCVPTIYVIRQSQSKNMDCAESAGMEMADGVAMENDMSAENDMVAEDVAVDNAYAEQEILKEEQSLIEEEGITEEQVVGDDRDIRKGLFRILEMTCTEDEILLTIEVIAAPGYEAGDVFTVLSFPEENGYQSADFIGELELLIEETEENLKILEILP